MGDQATNVSPHPGQVDLVAEGQQSTDFKDRVMGLDEFPHVGANAVHAIADASPEVEGDHLPVDDPGGDLLGIRS
jgi:hypothetical protein